MKIKMKKFKNKLAVKGSKSLLKAFVEELKELGYEGDGISDRYDWVSNIDTVLTNYGKKIGNYGYHNHTAGSESILILPQDWDKALKLAAEVEKEIPEY